MALYQAGSRVDGALLLDSQSTGTASSVTFQEKFTADYHTYLITAKSLQSANNWRLYMQLMVGASPTTGNVYTSTIATNIHASSGAASWGTAGSEVGYWVCFTGAGNATNELVDCQIVISAPLVAAHYSSFVSDASFMDDATPAMNRWYRASGQDISENASDGIKLYPNVGGVDRDWSGGTFTLYALPTGRTR